MAKSIKYISCPNCGSVDKKNLGNDKYECSNCYTEYFLDDDYTHIVHHHKNYTNQTPTTPPIQLNQTKKKVLYFIAIVVAVYLSMVFINSIFFNKPANVQNNTNFGTQFRYQETAIVKNKSGELFYSLLGIETKSFGSKSAKIIYYFYDKKGKKIKSEYLEPTLSKNAGIPFDKISFQNGDTYFIYNELRVFKVDADKKEVADVTEELFNLPEFSTGVAKVQRIYDQDGFKVLSQDGKSYVYLPIIKRVLPAEKEYEYRRMVPSNATSHTFYTFSKFDDAVADNSLLVKYHQKSEIGNLRDIPYFDIPRGSTSTTQIELRTKAAGLEDYRILNDRIYFYPTVLGYDDEMLIVQVKTDASDASSFKVQALSPSNGDVIWTYDLSHKDTHMKYRVQNAYLNMESVFLESANAGITLDRKTGKEIGSFSTL